MTPPDSDAAMRHECQCGYRVIGRGEALHTRYAVHTWSKCGPPEWTSLKPDSDAREAPARMDAPSGPRCWCGKPSREWDGWCGNCVVNPPPVTLPLSLAQRILAALEGEARSGNVSAQRLQALAAELREVMPK